MLFRSVDPPSPPHLKARPPITTKVSLALSRARSRLSPNRSMMPPPAGISCVNTMRIACESIGEDVTEDVEAAGDVDEEGSGI